MARNGEIVDMRRPALQCGLQRGQRRQRHQRQAERPGRDVSAGEETTHEVQPPAVGASCHARLDRLGQGQATMHLGFSSTDERAGGPRTGEISLSPYAKSGPSAIRDGRTLTWRRRAPQARSLLRIRNRGFRAALAAPPPFDGLCQSCHASSSVAPPHDRPGATRDFRSTRGGADGPSRSAATTRWCENARRSRSRAGQAHDSLVYPDGRIAVVDRRTTHPCRLDGTARPRTWTVDSRVWTDARLARAGDRTTHPCGPTRALARSGGTARARVCWPVMAARACCDLLRRPPTRGAPGQGVVSTRAPPVGGRRTTTRNRQRAIGNSFRTLDRGPPVGTAPAGAQPRLVGHRQLAAGTVGRDWWRRPGEGGRLEEIGQVVLIPESHAMLARIGDRASGVHRGRHHQGRPAAVGGTSMDGLVDSRAVDGAVLAPRLSEPPPAAAGHDQAGSAHRPPGQLHPIAAALEGNRQQVLEGHPAHGVDVLTDMVGGPGGGVGRSAQGEGHLRPA